MYSIIALNLRFATLQSYTHLKPIKIRRPSDTLWFLRLGAGIFQSAQLEYYSIEPTYGIWANDHSVMNSTTVLSY